MKTHTPCPDEGRLRELLDNRLSGVVQAEVTSHLDDCEYCQKSLEKLATGESRLSECLCHIGDCEPKRDSAYWPALASLEVSDSAQTLAQDLAVAAPPRLKTSAELDFLDPAIEAGRLGSLSHYDVVRIAGRGGMGMVLHAFDTHLQRDVALKVLDPRLAQDEIAQERFCREARAAAAIAHENVVAVHSVEHNEEKELPFLVMQLVDGETLEDLLAREGKVEPREIVRIGAQIAAGLAAAHDKQLVHRDIKPGNILIERETGRVKVTDFGLARAKEDVRLTISGMVAGTPLYMAPEQAHGEEVDERSDLFSFGVVLYEMATGESPFVAKTPLAVLKRLTEENPKPLHELNPDLPQWLADVIDKLLAKKPAERFATAREVADIFERHLAYLKTSDGTMCPKVRKQRAEARWAKIKLGAAAAAIAIVSGLAGAFLIPRGGAPVAPTPVNPSPALASTLVGNAGPVWSLAFTPTADQVAMAIDDGTVKIWDVASASVRATLPAHKAAIWGVAISPDGTLMATGSDDTTAKIWNYATRKELFTLPHTGGIRTVAFDQTGKILATGGRNGTVRLWNATTGDEILQTRGHSNIVTALAFSPDGKLLATGSGDKTVKIWDVATGEERLNLDGSAGGIFAVAFSPSGKFVATGGWDKVIRLYDADIGLKIATFESPTQDVWSLAFSPDGAWLVAGHEDRLITVWDVAAKKHLATLRGHQGTVYAVNFSADGRVLASASRDGTIRTWDRARIRE